MAPVKRVDAADLWAPGFILGMSFVVIVVATAIGSAIYVSRNRCVRRKEARQRAQAQLVPNAVAQEQMVKLGAGHFNGLNVNPSVVWPPSHSPRTSQPTPPEPQLSWPVYSVLPTLRPKEPIRVRVKKVLMWWKKDQVKREPFTVADVLRAIEEANTHANVRSQRPNLAPSPVNRQSLAIPVPSRTMPEIVVHPCDGTPCYSPALEEASMTPKSTSFPSATTSSTIPTDISDFEPETPVLLSPRQQSPVVYFPSPSIPSGDSLQVPMHSPTSRDDDRQDVVVNLSNFSGQKFVLSTPPPPKRNPQTAGHGRRGSPHIGLGFVRGLSARSMGTPELADICEDEGSPERSRAGSSFASESGVYDVVVPVSQSSLSPPSPTAPRFSSSYTGSVASSTNATAGHGYSQSSQSTWTVNRSSTPRKTQLVYLADEDGRGDLGDRDSESVYSTEDDDHGDEESVPNTASEDNFFDCSADFEEDITIQCASLVYQEA